MATKYLRACMINLVKVRQWCVCCCCHVWSDSVLLNVFCIRYPSLQTGFPSRDDSPSCEYSRVDFDSDEDFNSFFNCKCYGFSFTVIRISTFSVLPQHVFHGVFSCLPAFRAQQGEVLRSACRIIPLDAFQIAAEWLQYQTASPIDMGDTTCKCLSPKSFISLNLSSFLHQNRPMSERPEWGNNPV